jgi:anti-sigma-K factor RskA
MSDSGERDALAAEYALGALDHDEWQEAQRLIARDPAFARAVAAWEQHLAPMAALVDPAEPPANLWDRIDTATASANDNLVPLRRMRGWQASTAGALAIAASLAAFIVLRQPDTPHVAVLAPIAGGTAVLLATEAPGGHLTVRPNGTIVVPAGKDLELWALAKGETKPRSLGVLPADGRSLIAPLALDTQLLVSLEPRGGSPTGLPTGPVLYGGTLTQVN